MFYRRKIRLRHASLYILAMLLFTVVLPALCIKLFPSLLPNQENPVYDGTIPQNVRLYISEEKRYRKIPFEEYIAGVVASEMPSDFALDALKAQAVASRTYALGRIKAGSKLCNTVHCQVYRDHSISRKVKRAVKETHGQVLLYKGKLAASALYFSSSAGPTEDSQDVFSGAYAYLQSVESSYEPGATHKKEKKSFTMQAFTEKTKKAFPDVSFGTVNKSNIKIKSHSKGGRVNKMQVGEAVLSGSDVRTALGLYSARFNVSFIGNQKIVFTTAGSGHGVGMSQYGAQGLAEKGKDFQEILSHYYQGAKVSAGHR